jgi:Fic family protein
MIPNPDLLIGPFVRREAEASSRIEGTVTNFRQLVAFEIDPVNADDPDDRQEVLNYVRALEHGMELLKQLPISLRLIREVHAILMTGARGADKMPGKFRRIQNMLGQDGQSPAQARFVPPPVIEMNEALDHLEKYIHKKPSEFPVLVDLAFIHYQFETIHPFLDGNGRLGRLLISLLLCERGCLTHPLLYLSAYFERHRKEYADCLLEVSRRGEWIEWIEFFLRAVAVQSTEAVRRCDQLLELRSKVQGSFLEARHSARILKLIDQLFEAPAVTAKGVATNLKVTFLTAQGYIDKLISVGFLTEITGRTRDRIYVAEPIIEIIEKTDEDIII